MDNENQTPKRDAKRLLDNAITKMVDCASTAPNAEDALRYTQAALNLADIYAQANMIGLRREN